MSYFGVKHCLAYRVCPDVLKMCAGTRSEHFSYFGVKHVLAYRVCTEVLKACAGTRFEQLADWVLSILLLIMHALMY